MKDAKASSRTADRGVVPRKAAEIAARPIRNPKIPVELSYPVIKEDREAPVKRTVYVRLNMKVSAQVLREIALEIKSKEIEQYEITYILYYTSGKGPDRANGYNDPWASTHFNPTLEVDVMGLTIDQEASLRARAVPLPQGSVLLGKWLIDISGYGCLTMIYQSDNQWWLSTLFPGSKEPTVRLCNQLATRSETNLLVFQKEKGTDRYVVDPKGSLLLFSEDTELLCEAETLAYFAHASTGRRTSQ
jgi:hypothetical protein